MAPSEQRALYQRFLPDGGEQAFVWKYAQAVGGRRPRHFHAEPELNLVVRGAATFGIGQNVTRVSAGEMLAFPAGQDHALIEASPDLYLYAIGLEPAYASEVLGAPSGPLVPLHVRLDQRELGIVIERASTLVDRRGAKQLGAELWERCHWLGLNAARARRPAHVLTRRAMAFVRTAPELPLEALAKELRTHPSEVSRHFRADVGMTLVRYRTRARLFEVIRRYDAGERDLTRAAGVAGFGSYSQCHRAFVSELGCGPRRFFADERNQMQLAYAD